MGDIEPALRNHILSVCSALGGYEDLIKEDGDIERVYRMGDECLGRYRNEPGTGKPTF